MTRDENVWAYLDHSEFYERYHEVAQYLRSGDRVLEVGDTSLRLHKACRSEGKSVLISSVDPLYPEPKDLGTQFCYAMPLSSFAQRFGQTTSEFEAVIALGFDIAPLNSRPDEGCDAFIDMVRCCAGTRLVVVEFVLKHFSSRITGEMLVSSVAQRIISEQTRSYSVPGLPEVASLRRTVVFEPKSDVDTTSLRELFLRVRYGVHESLPRANVHLEDVDFRSGDLCKGNKMSCLVARRVVFLAGNPLPWSYVLQFRNNHSVGIDLQLRVRGLFRTLNFGVLDIFGDILIERTFEDTGSEPRRVHVGSKETLLIRQGHRRQPVAFTLSLKGSQSSLY